VKLEHAITITKMDGRSFWKRLVLGADENLADSVGQRWNISGEL